MTGVQTCALPISPLTPPSLRKEAVETSAYDVRLKDLVVKDIERMERQALSPISSNYRRSEEASSPVKGAPIIGHPPIHYSNYQKTSQADFDAMKAVAITSENLHKSQTFTHLLHQLSGYQLYVTLHLEHSKLL